MNHVYEIVIVEDCPADAELMIRALKQNNLANKLIVLEDGEEAIDYIFCRGKYDGNSLLYNKMVIFLDLKLPKIGGLEVLAQIKSNCKTKNIPVVIVTSSNEDPDITAAYNLGANSYVVKPVNYKDFMDTISRIGVYWLVVNRSPHEKC